MKIKQLIKDWKTYKESQIEEENRLITKEEKKLTKEEKKLTKERELKKTINKHFSKVILFPGTIEDYERFTGYPVTIIDTGTRFKGVVMMKQNGNKNDYKPQIDETLKKQLFEEGIESIVGNYTESGSNSKWYDSFCGVPVKKAE